MKGCENHVIKAVLFWKNPAIRNPFLFSVGLHVFITIIVFLPTSFFHSTTTPEIYSVELIDLTDPTTEPEPVQAPPAPIVKPKPVTEAAVSAKPILSTRNIPQAPTKIKILRPRKIKKNLRKDQPPIDQTMVLAALQRMKNMEQQQLAQEDLVKANEAVVQANEEVLQALRESILLRQPTAPSSVASAASSKQTTASSERPQSGQRANSILTQYIATLGQHIGQYWRLPEGQKWNRKLHAAVLVKIKTDGIVISAKLQESSKSNPFDKFVIETIEKASPLPPFPQELTQKPLMLHFYPEGLQ